MNPRIKELQHLLSIELTGFLDELTKSALKNLQLRYGLFPSGVLDEPTIERIKNRHSIDLKSIPENDKSDISTNYIKEEDIVIPNISSDLSELVTSSNIKEYKLSSGQFINSSTKKNLIFIHHTAGNADPYGVIKDWNTDSRGAIGTHYVIGGPNAKTGDSKFDGEIVRAIDDNYYAYHLGGSLPSKLTTESIGIEICNFGYLTEKNGKFYTYVNTEVHPSQVVKLDKPFRGYTAWHKYSDKQIDALINLLKMLAKKHNIDIKKGLAAEFKAKDAFTALGLNQMLMSGSNYVGVWSHTNVRSDKFDIYPYKPLIDKLKNL